MSQKAESSASHRSGLSAVILAAGFGSRLRPATDDRPKALVEIADGVTILDRLVGQCAACDGFDDVILVTGYRADAVDAWASERDFGLPVHTVFNPDYDTMNNAQSLYVARERVAGRSFVKFDGDLVLHPRILPKLMAHESALSTIVLDTDRTLTDEDMKASLAAGRVGAFGKGLANEVSAGISIGIERVLASDADVVFDGIRNAMSDGHTDWYYEDVYSVLIAADALAMDAVTLDGLKWTEIDTPDELSAARELVAGWR